MLRIIGIDPGLRCTGYGVIDTDGHRHTYISSGQIRTGEGSVPERLGLLHQELYARLKEFTPQCASVETSFVSKNVAVALKLGQARGALISACAFYGLEVFEYSPRLMKNSITGVGHADKEQVQFMVQRLLNLAEVQQADESDALGLAICHAHTWNPAMESVT